VTVELRSLIAWAVMFLAVELCAHFRLPRPAAAAALVAAAAAVVYLWPIVTLSRTVWGGIHWWHPLADAVIAFTIVLDIHLLWMLSAGYLIAVAAGIFLAVGAHALQLYLGRK
jgi:hypothetical protein